MTINFVNKIINSSQTAPCKFVFLFRRSIYKGILQQPSCLQSLKNCLKNHSSFTSKLNASRAELLTMTVWMAVFIKQLSSLIFLPAMFRLCLESLSEITVEGGGEGVMRNTRVPFHFLSRFNVIRAYVSSSAFYHLFTTDLTDAKSPL